MPELLVGEECLCLEEFHEVWDGRW